MRLTGDHMRLTGDHMRLGGDYMRLGGDHMRLRGDHMRLRGDYVRLGGDHMRLRGDHMRLRGDHMRLGGDHMRLRGDHMRLYDSHLRPVKDSKTHLVYEYWIATTVKFIRLLLQQICPLYWQTKLDLPPQAMGFIDSFLVFTRYKLMYSPCFQTLVTAHRQAPGRKLLPIQSQTVDAKLPPLACTQMFVLIL